MKNKQKLLISLIAMLNIALLGVAAVADPTPIWESNLDNDASITVDGGAIVSGPSSYVTGAYGKAFAGNGSVYANWGNSDVAAIFDGVWNNSLGSTVDLYFHGDHWDTHSGDSGFWSVTDRYGGNDGYIMLSVRDGSLRFPMKDSYTNYGNNPHLTGVALANDVTYRLTMRQQGTNFEVYLDGGAYSNATPVYTTTFSQTISFPEYNDGSPGRDMSVANRAIFGGILQGGEWVDNVRVYNGYYTPAEIGIPSGYSKGDLNGDNIVDFKDVKIMVDNWLVSGLTPSEGNIDEIGVVNFLDYAILAEDWLLDALVSITSQPENLSIFEGQTATFTVQAEGSTPLIYQWQKDEVNLSNGGRISGAATGTLQITDCNGSDEAAYRCVVENYYSSVISDEATLTVALGSPTGRQTLYESGTGRRYILYVPVDYDYQKSYPMIISSHGTGQDGDTEMDSTGSNSGYDNGTPTWPTLAEQHDVIVACPDMTGAYGPCAIGSTQLTQLASDDTAIMNIISDVNAVYNINTLRIMVTGFSGGGHVVHYVGLRHPDVFSAICARHGNFDEDEVPSPLPLGITDVPVYIFNGTNDAVCGPDESITWYTAQGFNYLETDDFDTYPSSEHTTDRHHAANWFMDLNIGTSSSGHNVTYKGDTLLLIGDSGTQCAAQNSNLDHREWIDDCNDRGIRAIHVWAFVPVRQKQDASVIEDRWGYVIPDVMPWARKTSGLLALDQRYQWDLTQFDEGVVGDCNHYWPRMRDMASYAKSKNMLLGVTMFTGWTKHDYSWIYHPLNVDNGGHLTNNTDAVIIDTPGTEVWQETYSGAWSNAKKTQWVWEQYSIKMINDLGSMGNVFFVFFDEHSYSEGNMGDHFRDFFRSRGQFWVDWNARRSTVDAIFEKATTGDDKNADTIAEFNKSPARPFLMLEAGPYMGDGLRESICTMAVGVGHYFHHADEGQETVRTGIMGYDPYVPSGDKGMYKRDWLGHASRFFNEEIEDIDSMVPANALTSTGSYCLADNGSEYAVYSKNGTPTNITVNLSTTSGKTLDCRFYDPENGVFEPNFLRTGGSSSEVFTKPDTSDWLLHILAGTEGIVSDSNLAAHLTFEEGFGSTSADITGNGHTATLTSTSWGSGYVSVPTSPASAGISIASDSQMQGQSFTWDLWFEAGTATTHGRIAAQTDSVGGTGPEILAPHTSDTIGVRINNASAAFDVPTIGTRTSEGPPDHWGEAVESFHRNAGPEHLILTHDASSKTVRIFVGLEGQTLKLTFEATYTGSYAVGTVPLVIGNNPAGDRVFASKCYQFAYYDRPLTFTADGSRNVTDGEVYQNHSAGSGN